MRVKATHVGFYVKLRDPGDEFDIPDDGFSAKWMERVGVAAEPAEPAPPAKSAEVPETPLVPEAAIAVPVVKKRRGRKPKASE